VALGEIFGNELIVPVAYVSPKPSSTISRSALVLISLCWLLSEPSGITKPFLLFSQIANRAYQLVQTIIVSFQEEKKRKS